MPHWYGTTLLLRPGGDGDRLRVLLVPLVGLLDVFGNPYRDLGGLFGRGTLGASSIESLSARVSGEDGTLIGVYPSFPPMSSATTTAEEGRRRTRP